MSGRASRSASQLVGRGLKSHGEEVMSCGDVDTVTECEGWSPEIPAQHGACVEVFARQSSVVWNARLFVMPRQKLGRSSTAVT